jgi:hypothetical protein
MKTYILPIKEMLEGWYEIEANSLEEAKAIAIQGDFTELTDPNYRKGYVDWDEEKIYEKETNG